MDVYGYLGFSIVGFLIGSLTVTYALYRLRKETFIEDSLENFLSKVANDEELQKFIYQIGGILGSGVNGGLGLNLPTKQRGGKFKWQDLALEMATQFISKSINNPSPSPAPSSLPQSQDILSKKLSDKW